MARIRPVKNLREFFERSVADSMRRNNIRVGELTSSYVVDLLTLYSRSEELFEHGPDGPGLRPLALVLADAVDSGAGEMNRALKRVGDQSLFVAGFFGEYLNTRIVDLDYYVSMGGSAYAALSRAERPARRGVALGRVFAELAEKFAGFVDVLTDLRAEGSTDDEDLLRLYETWIRTGSRRAARLLRSHGIEPQRGSPGSSAKPH
jgi:hypothetical protein